MHKSSAHALSLLAVCLFSLLLRFCLVLACRQFSCTMMFYDAACVDKAQRTCLALPLAVVSYVSVVRAYAYGSRLWQTRRPEVRLECLLLPLPAVQRGEEKALS